MSTLSGVLTALAAPLAKKVLSALGIGFLTYAGVDAAVNGALSAAKSNFGGVSADITSILALSGMFTAMSIIAGGITAGLTMMVFSKLAKIG